MAASDHSSGQNARFRSATEFPKTVASLDAATANDLYAEMRGCLIFTNRSRAQLIRWNDQHKHDKLELKEKVHRLHGMISQLNLEKQNLTQRNQQIVAELESEISSMATHLDRLSEAFEPFADIDNIEQSKWSFLALPNRFFKFLQAVRSIVVWWRDDHDSEPPSLAGAAKPKLQGDLESEEQDRRDRPQMHSDPASINRSLLDR